MARHALIHRDRHTDRDPDHSYDRDTDRYGDDRTVDRSDGDRRMVNDRFEPVSPRETYGGTNWGACFFGWLVAIGVTTLLVAIAAAVAAAVGAQLDWTSDDASSHARNLALTGAIAAAVIMFIGYYAGGYVAGRMSRFDGVRQGVGVWLIGILTAAVAGGLVALLNARTSVFDDVDWTPGDLTGNDATIGAIVTGVVLLVVMLVGAVLGSAVGRRYHRRIDAVVATSPR